MPGDGATEALAAARSAKLSFDPFATFSTNLLMQGDLPLFRSINTSNHGRVASVKRNAAAGRRFESFVVMLVGPMLLAHEGFAGHEYGTGQIPVTSQKVRRSKPNSAYARPNRPG